MSYLDYSLLLSNDLSCIFNQSIEGYNYIPYTELYRLVLHMNNILGDQVKFASYETITETRSARF